ncbi:MAG: 2-hydroxyacyl-CoA dehydratase [Deltaproteobacteria bacterium]|nr:2-hydroxyacyl-CoA dehydratase [Deltaproteobacteria bacterium]
MDGAKPLPMIAHAAKSAAAMEKLLAHPRAADLVLRRFLGGITVDHEPGFARGMRATLLKIGAAVLPFEAIPAMAKVTGATRRMHEGALQAHAHGEPIVWVTWPVPAALVASFGVVVYCPENFYSVANASAPDGSTRMCEVADRHGVPSEICSINRCMLGAYFAGEVPKPTLVITNNHPCDGNHSANTILRDLADCEHFSVGGAYDKSPETVAVWARSAWELIAFLEANLKRPMDWERLRRHVDVVNRINRALNHVTELHRSAPCPGLVNPLAVFWRMVAASGWVPEMAEGAELLEKAAEEIVAKARKRGAPRERLRVVLGDQAIAWTDFAGWLRREYGAAIVSDYIGSFRHPEIDTSSRERMIEGLVLDRLHMSMVRQAHGAMEYTLDELSTVLTEYDADCVIFHANVGCKHNMALRHEIEDLCRQAKVPALFLDADIVDRRLVGEKALREKIRAFLAAEGLPR